MKTASTSKASVEQADPVFSEPSVTDAELRCRMVAEAAYYRAEARGFAGGCEEEDWLAAEAEVDGTLASASGPMQA